MYYIFKRSQLPGLLGPLNKHIGIFPACMHVCENTIYCSTKINFKYLVFFLKCVIICLNCIRLNTRWCKFSVLHNKCMKTALSIITIINYNKVVIMCDSIYTMRHNSFCLTLHN